MKIGGEISHKHSMTAAKIEVSVWLWEKWVKGFNFTTNPFQKQLINVFQLIFG